MRNFSQAKMKTIRKEMVESLEVVARRHGVTIEIGSIQSANFLPTTEVKAQIRCSIPDAQGVPQNLEALMWRRECRRHGFEESDLGRTVKVGGRKYTVRGISHNRSLALPATVRLRRVEDGQLRFLPVKTILHELRTA